MVVSPFVLIYLTTNTDVFLWTGLLQNVSALAVFMFMYIPESPVFLLEKERFDLARKDIAYMLKFNNATEEKTMECMSVFERFATKKQSVAERAIQA